MDNMKIKGMELMTDLPGEKWSHGFPVGNGQIGAMVYGSCPKNCISLSENTFYSGKKETANVPAGAAKSFQTMRALAQNGDFEGVHKEAAEHFIGKRGNYGTNLPVANLYLDYAVKEKNHINGQTVKLIQRSLDIMTGTAKRLLEVTKEVSTKTVSTVEERIFATHADHMLVLTLKADKKFSVAIQLKNHTQGWVQYLDRKIQMKAWAYENMHCDEDCGVCLSATLFLETDGTLSEENNVLVMRDGTMLNGYLLMQTNFAERIAGVWSDVISNASKEMLADIRTKMRDWEFPKSAEKVYQRHVKDFTPVMKRSQLVLCGDKEQDKDIEQDMFLYQYGRYLLLSASREDSLLPAHLQGIWNDNVACRIGWTCDMHLDINTQMNYWPAEVTNLTEVNEPMFHYLEKLVAPAGKNTAIECYGLDGWVAELVSNAWGYAYPYWADTIAPCPTGGLWLLTHLWEHYQYTESIDFLSERAFPLIEESAKFFNSYVFEKEPGVWSCGPSISPENSFGPKGEYQISNGCTYELIMIRELFKIFCKASEILGQTKNHLYKSVCEKKDKLLPFRILEDGTIAEFDHQEVVFDRQHRHTSHLLGLFPFAQISPVTADRENIEGKSDEMVWNENTEAEKESENRKLCAAAEKTIQQKITPVQNWEDTGWASSMLLLYEARLLSGDKSYEHLSRMKTKLLERNQLIYHPPTRGADAFDHVYELDGNTGITSGIAEMLLQSHNGILHILPALPSIWKNGQVTGLKARGNITVSIKWKKGKAVEVCLRAGTDRSVIMLTDKIRQQINLKKDQEMVWNP